MRRKCEVLTMVLALSKCLMLSKMLLLLLILEHTLYIPTSLPNQFSPTNTI